MRDQLKRIFDLDKVTYDVPGESREQEAAFIEVTQARCRVREKLGTARVTGKLHVFANLDKLPYGYFSKCIAAADPEDVKPFVFYDFEENKGTIRNIAERSLGFLYFFHGQYDPNVGTLSSINLSYAESDA